MRRYDLTLVHFCVRSQRLSAKFNFTKKLHMKENLLQTISTKFQVKTLSGEIVINDLCFEAKFSDHRSLKHKFPTLSSSHVPSFQSPPSQQNQYILI